MSKKLDALSFSKQGYLNEINRIYLHPLGLALDIEDDKLVVIDERQNKTGIVYKEIGEIYSGTARQLLDEYHNRCLYRLAKYGWSVQPLYSETQESQDI